MSTEFWLSGPLPRISPWLQPAAHALLQVKADTLALMNGFPESRIFEKPGGAASVSFHLKHISGVIDRMFTYAEGKPLSETQWAYLREEEIPDGNLEMLLNAIKVKVEEALEKLEQFNEEELLKPVKVGRKGLPSTVWGLIFHAAEHCQRHYGQLYVTVRFLS